MDRILAPYTEHAYALFRMVAGFLFFCHGAKKIFGMFGGMGDDSGVSVPLFGLIWFAGMIELVGGALVAVGFQAGSAAFLCSGQMAVAYFMAHQAKGLLPIQNGGELAALYAFMFLLIATRGSGIWSLDAARGTVAPRA
jgi:putative oxidoreductase